MSKELELDGKSYITSKRAAEITGYAQDYIGQLARGGEIDARKIDGSWYVVLESLSAYGTEAEAKPKVVPEPQQREAANDTIVSFDGKEFISSKRGAELSGYSQDYVVQLARGGKILSRQVGSKWYVAKNGNARRHRRAKNQKKARSERGNDTIIKRNTRHHTATQRGNNKHG